MKSAEMKHYDHIICGGGLVGSLWALYLKKRGCSVAVFQSYWDLRKQVISQGRSINLILSRRAIQALDKVGIKYDVLHHASVIKGRAIHPPNGQIVYLPYGIYENQVSFCIERNKLNQILLSIAQSNNVDLYFRHFFEDADFNTNTFTFSTDTETVNYCGTYLYGADGANSKVRDVINRQIGGSQQTHWFQAQYKELFLQADQNGHFMLDPQSVHLWPRGDYFMMGQPNLNGTFSLTLVLPSEGEVNYNTRDEQVIDEFFRQNFPDVYQLIPNVVFQFLQNPVGYFGTLFTRPWNYKNKAVLLGDAAHALVPFFWQSVNFAFNDCVVLDSCIQKYGFSKAFEMFSTIQKPNGDSIANMSVKNYYKLADPKYIIEKQIQVRLSQIFPKSYISKNRAVFYQNYSYQEVEQIWQKNEKILEQLSKGLKSANQVNIQLAQKLLSVKKKP